jgi:hypothetical protein
MALQEARGANAGGIAVEEDLGAEARVEGWLAWGVGAIGVSKALFYDLFYQPGEVVLR